MLKRLILGLMMALISLPSFAQTHWTAWLYTSSDGSITRISPSGEIIDAFRLPITQAFNAYGHAAVISPNGRFIAYTVDDTTSSTENRLLIVYDTRADIIRFTYDLSGVDSLDFERKISPWAFDETAQTFAFGLVRDGTWELVVADLVTESLKGGQPYLETDSGLADGLPMVMRLQGEVVWFYLYQMNGEPSRAYPVYRWQTGMTPAPSGSVAAFSDIQGFGDVVTPYHDPDLPTSAVTGLMYNSVEIHPITGDAVRIVESAALDIRQTWWVADAQQVLIKGFDSSINAEVFEVVDLGGQVIGQFQVVLGDLRGTPTGVVGTFATGGGVGLAHIETLTGDFPARTIYTTTDPTARLIAVTRG